MAFLSADLLQNDSFLPRHLGPNLSEQQLLLKEIGFDSLEKLVDQAIPNSIRFCETLDLPLPATETEALQEIKSLAQKNRVTKSYIGMGYYDCFTPPVIQRNILENPVWYTAYTPYQAEIAQGRLEALLNFQTLVTDLTAMEIANASLLDEATAAAEAMALCFNLKGSAEKNIFWVSSQCHPQTIEVIQTRAEPLKIQVQLGDALSLQCQDNFFGLLLQYPDTQGAIQDYESLILRAHEKNALVVVAADLLSLTLLRPPGEFAADVVVGNSQRFGVPLGYGGPHAAFFATRDAFKRQMPGRLIGVSKDAEGSPAFRLSLQTREQHIRRDKATSNICTAQVLLAVMASMYAVYHGPEGLKKIAMRIHALANFLAEGLKQLGFHLTHNMFFDTLCVQVPETKSILKRAQSQEVNLRYLDDKTLSIALDETTTPADIEKLWELISGKKINLSLEALKITSA